MSTLIPKSPKTGGEILLYQTEDGRTRLQCRLEDETFRLTQAQIAELFQPTPQNVTLHLKAIFAEGELAEEATCKDCLQVRDEGKRAVTRKLRHYRLEAILAVGYRVRSHRGTQFRQWATARLGEYLVKGFMPGAGLDRLPAADGGWPAAEGHPLAHPRVQREGRAVADRGTPLTVPTRW
jgi:hypothetical protein